MSQNAKYLKINAKIKQEIYKVLPIIISFESVSAIGRKI